MIYVRTPSAEERQELKRMTRQEIGRVSQRAQMILLSAQHRTVPISPASSTSSKNGAQMAAPLQYSRASRLVRWVAQRAAVPAERARA